MKFNNHEFHNQNIELDNNEFNECKFTNCKILYFGFGPVKLGQNSFKDCHWEFTGNAGNTLAFLAHIYQGGAQELVDGLFNSIRQGVIPSTVKH